MRLTPLPAPPLPLTCLIGSLQDGKAVWLSASHGIRVSALPLRKLDDMPIAALTVQNLTVQLIFQLYYQAQVRRQKTALLFPCGSGPPRQTASLVLVTVPRSKPVVLQFEVCSIQYLVRNF